MNRDAIAGRLMRSQITWPSYTDDLCLEALLDFSAATGKRPPLNQVLAVWEFRGNPRETLTIGNSYFTSLHFETYRHTGDARFVEGLAGVADEWRRTAPRTSEGAVGHRYDPRGAVLLDMLAGYAPLMAAAGALSGDESFFDECAHQCLLYRNILRNPDTGLWHHARDWQTPGILSPAGWCRGQGWAMRALIKSMERMPASNRAHATLRDLLSELTTDLLRFQQPSGMWHQLVDEPDSYPETSGTGFIASSLQKSILCGRLDASAAAIRAAMALTDYIAPEGAVRSGCPGCPPMAARAEYLGMGPADNDPHAVAGVLMALTGNRQ